MHNLVAMNISKTNFVGVCGDLPYMASNIFYICSDVHVKVTKKKFKIIIIY
jgi:hypothetical protein